MKHPFAELIGLSVDRQEAGCSECSLNMNEQLSNPHGVAHGAVIYASADTGMGAALYPTLKENELCATIEIKINYFRPVFTGSLYCQTTMVNRGKSIANLDAEIYCEEKLVAKANGHYSIFSLKQG